MNAFAEARYAQAVWQIESLLSLLSHPGDGVTRSALHRALGELAAMKQLLDMEADLTVSEADARCPVRLTVVR